MRDNEYYRCICNIERVPEIKDFIAALSLQSGSNVVYFDEAAIMDDLDYVDRVTAFDNRYDPEGFRYHCGSLWAQRGQDLILFWHMLYEAYGEAFEARVPIVFTRDTLFNELYD